MVELKDGPCRGFYMVRREKGALRAVLLPAGILGYHVAHPRLGQRPSQGYR